MMAKGVANYRKGNKYALEEEESKVKLDHFVSLREKDQF